MTRKDLVEKMKMACFGDKDTKYEQIFELGVAECMLKVVLDNIDEIVYVRFTPKDRNEDIPNVIIELREDFQ